MAAVHPEIRAGGANPRMSAKDRTAEDRALVARASQGDAEAFRGESAFSTWLYTITLNTCLSARQREARRQEREYGPGEEMPYYLLLSEPQGGEADPEAATLSAERRDEIQEALFQVRAEHRAALVLRHMEGLSYAEIAEVLEVPEGTAKGWVSRGRAEMLLALSEEDHDRSIKRGEEQ